MAKCSRCNNEIEDNAMFCEHCGAEVDKQEYTKKGGYNFSKAKAVAVIIAVLAVIGIVGFAIFKIAGGSGVSASDYVNNWNSRVEVVKEDLSSVYKDTLVEDMLKELDMDDADKNGNTYEFELCEAYGAEAVLTFETGGVGTVNEVSVLMETEVFYAFINDFYYEEDALEGLKLIHTIALSSMLDNKAAYRDAAEIVDDAWDEMYENMDEYYDEDESAWIYNKTYDNIEITIEQENIDSEDVTFTAKRV